MSITEIAIKRPLLITVIFVTLILFGYISYRSLSYNLLPRFDVNTISISTTYPGAAPSEVETSITKPIEDAVSAIEGVDQITSRSAEGISNVNVSLKAGTIIKDAQLDAERKIKKIIADLPERADDPVVGRLSSDDQPIIKISVTSKLAGNELFDFINLQARPMLNNVEGVAAIDITGGEQREIRVALDNDKLKAYHISSSEIYNAVALSGASYPGGSVVSNDARFSLNLNAKVSSVEALRDINIKQNVDGSRVLLRDVAYITDAQKEATTLNRINGVPAIGIQIRKQSDANAVKVSEGIHKRLAEIKKTYADKDFNYYIASDQSIFTLAAADAVIDDLFLAILIVAVVMLFFLHSIRSATFVLVALPSAIIPTFIGMWAMNFSLNLMSLMSLSLVVGILVDDSIVVLENIYRHLEMGKDKRTAAIDGRKEIGFTAIAITLVDVVVFLPLSLSGGTVGSILREYALVVVFSTLMSLVVAFTLTPMLASRWGKLSHPDDKNLWGRINKGLESLIERLRDSYTGILAWSLRHKRYIFLIVLLSMAGSIALIPTGFIGTAFIAPSDRGELYIQIDMDSYTPLKETNQTIAKIESILLKHPEVVNVFSNVGIQSGGFGGAAASNNSNLAELSVLLVDKNKRSFSTEEFGKMIREEIGGLPGISPTIQVIGITGQAKFDLQLGVEGANIDSINKAAAVVKGIMAGTPGADYVRYSTKAPKTQISIKLNREKMAAFGVTVGDVGSSIQYAFQGNDRTKFNDKGEEYDINLKLDEGDKRTINDVFNTNIYSSRGAAVPLTQVAEITEVPANTVLERTDRFNSVTVNGAAVGRPSGTIMNEVMQKLAKAKMPEGVHIVQLGTAKNQGDAFGSLGLAFGLGIVLMYLIMVALYESVIYPFVVLFSLPVAIIGAIFALALTLNSLSLFPILGVIMLLGLVAKNAILLVDFTNQEKAKGMPVKDALIAAGRERLRPILMTTFAMIFGMLPMALATGAGAEIKNGMAWVIIGGLTSSLLFTLVLVPSVYLVVEDWKVKINNWFSGRKKKKEARPMHTT